MPQPISTSLGFASGTLSCFLFQPEVLDAKGNRGLAGALPVPAKGGHVGGEGVVGEHQEITAHPLVALDGRERARGGLATAAGGGGGLLPVVAVLRRSSTSVERTRDAQHDVASDVAHTVSVKEARSGGNTTMASLACRPWWTAP